MTSVDAHPRRRSELGVDTIGWLRQQLTGLGGFSTMLFELVQNAEDEGCERLELEFNPLQLIVRNTSVFTNADWDRIQLMASGGKAYEEKPKIGTFGIGFISVYQITDCPEIISAGEHAIFRPERQRTDEGRSIEWMSAPSSTTGTEFRLPWARTRTRLREWLEQPVIGDADIERFWNEAIEALPDALIFLTAIRTVSLTRAAETVSITRQDGERAKGLAPRTITITQDGTEIGHRKWLVVDKLLPRPSGTPSVRADRKPQISLAVADAHRLDDFPGRLYCFLPTQHETWLHFHFQGTFFAKSDRKGIERDGGGEHVLWNRALLNGVPLLFGEIAPELFERLGFKRFYELIPAHDFESREFPELNPLKDVIAKAARTLALIPDRTGAARSSSDICFGDQLSDDELAVLESLGASFVHPDISASRNWLAKFGVQPFTLARFRELPAVKAIEDGISLSAAPEALRERDSRLVLYAAISKLLARPKQTGAEEIVGTIPLAISLAKTLRSPKSLWKADAEAQGLFAASLGDSEFLLADQAIELPPALLALAPTFNLGRGLSELEEWGPERIAALVKEDSSFLPRLYLYLQNGKLEILEGLRARVRKLPAFLATDGHLHELKDLSLPGSFADPLRLGITIDLDAIFIHLAHDEQKELRRFLEDLGVEPLSLATYCTQHVKRYFDELGHQAGSDWPPTALAILDLLRSRLREYQDDPTVVKALRSCPLVPASTEDFEYPEAVYFPSEPLDAVFGGGEYDHVAHEMVSALTPGWREFYEIIGVKIRPRISDVIGRIQETANEEFSIGRNARLRTLFDFLNDNYAKLGQSDRDQIVKLRDLAWIPKLGDEARLGKPSTLFTRARRYLFETQAEFIAFDEPSPDFRQQLGLRTEPPPNLVVSHLMACAAKAVQVNREVYRFLSLHSDDPALAALRGKPCIDVGAGKYAIGSHVFFDQVPFGKYRYSLGSELQEFRAFFEAVGVRPVSQLIANDYAGVLSDICDEFEDGRALDDPALNVVITIYRWAQTELDRGQQVGPAFSSLTQSRCVVGVNKHLHVPRYVLIADKSYLAEVFKAALKDRLIPKDRNTWRALRECLAVKTLSECVRAEITAREGEAVDQEMRLLLLTRRLFFERVIETRKREYPAGWNDGILETLEVRRLARLEARYTLDGDISTSTEPQKLAAWYDKSIPAILVSGAPSSVPAMKIARELATAVNEDVDPSQLVPLFERILAEHDLGQIDEYLDEAGIDRIADSGEARAEGSTVVRDIGAKSGDNERVATEEVAPTAGAIMPSDGEGARQTDHDTSQLNADCPGGSNESGSIEGGEQQPEAGERSGQRGFADSGTVGTGQQQKQQDAQGPGIERRSYVRVRLGSRLRNPDDALANRERRRIEIAAEDKVKEYEQSHNRSATRPTDPKCGYDFDSVGRDEHRCIEVKGLNETWDGFQALMTANEFRAAWELGDRYYLYVVDKIVTGSPRLQIVQNPAHSGDYYAFDNPEENIRFDEDAEESQ